MKIVGEPTWNMMREEIRFCLQRDEERFYCAVSQIALNDYYRTEDTQEAAFMNFRAHTNTVVTLAMEQIDNGQVRNDGVYFVSSTLFGS
ncbi:hypothetical protein C9J12_27385 [Photobacterium frigidiphilum]|uniref:DUF1488 domain-containing protein n=1 Tax=Photobacterium frigidiphilum TaxID=264736 RepID=A0A2T3J6W0_9GAMM|nr:DUF1488 family protein [Photobacterium frigidiphilum]PSU44277.1 hypothetical protein C9J12_27385 [Photobacterium frigidiphilum]